MEKYKHTVHYYETDRMGIVHHSNYIRWMEEARIDFLNQIGWGYEKLEACGIVSPVTAVECKYKQSTTFPDEVFIEVLVEEFRGVRLKLKYVMERADGKPVCEASSEHCFLDSNGRLVRLDRKYPEFDRILKDLAGRQESSELRPN
ncbi:MAG: acyl-CoA thioesterase [Lachnospiraceae bacterium]|nr:acyl-CoA thioesterase [Lachnospiraceae bacterium]